MYDDDAEFDELILTDVDGTLERLQAEKARLEGLRAGMRVDDSRELLKCYKITEPLREGVAKMERELGEAKQSVQRSQVQMHLEAAFMKEAKDGTDHDGCRRSLFELQAGAAIYMMRAEEIREHLKALTDRAGPQPTGLEVGRAAAQIEMYEYLGTQLVDVVRLQSWFSKKKEEAAAV